MSMVVLLDAGPLGLITNPKASSETHACSLWLEALILREIQDTGHEVIIAMTNVGHLSRLARAKEWRNIA